MSDRVADSTSPLRLALCITELNVGGAERCLVELATRIDRQRFAPVVYVLSSPPSPESDSLWRRLEAAGVETRFLDAQHVWQFASVVRRLADLLKQQRPEVLQTFLFHANVAGRCAARRANVPHVLCGVRVAERGVRWHLWVDRATRRFVDRFFCVSQAVADHTRREIGLADDRVVVIPNGVDYEHFASASPADLTQLGLTSGRRAVTYVGRLERQKGVDALIEHSPLWLDRLPSHDLVVVGSGPMQNELQALADRLGVRSRIHFAGWRSNVAGILKASDLLVLPSRWEGMPNVVLEAMAAGRAVASTDTEGVRELLGDGAAMQVVDRDDYRGLTEKIAELAADPSKRQQFEIANSLRARDFGWGKVADSYERLFDEVARRPV